MFGTKDVEESAFTPKWITPGVHEVVIDSIQGIEADKAYIEFKFRLPEGDNKDTSSQRLYIHTPKSFRLNMSRIKYIAKHVVKEVEIDSCESSSVMEYGEQLDSLMGGKTLRMKFNGEQYVKDGEVKTRAVLPLNNFCEALEATAEYAVVPKEASTLVYDVNKDLKKVAVPEGMPVSQEKSDDLPF
jgi:hypothetical protein